MSNPLSLFGKDDYRTAVLPQEIPIRTRYGREPGAGRRIRRAWDLQGYTLKRDPGPNNYCEGRKLRNHLISSADIHTHRHPRRDRAFSLESTC